MSVWCEREWRMSVKSAKSDARAYETKLQSIRERYEKMGYLKCGESVVCRISGWAFCGGRRRRRGQRQRLYFMVRRGLRGELGPAVAVAVAARRLGRGYDVE